MGTVESDDQGRVDEATRAEEEREATATASAGRGPTPDEERAAETSSVDPDVARENKKAVERGAAVRGEGQID
jgi:hypothetical protein